MKVLNVHERIVHQPKDQIAALIATLSSKEDRVWPKEQWPRMKLDAGLQAGSKGGHGPIRYTVQEYLPGELIEFKFTRPQGFDGIHRFELEALSENKTSVRHVIQMQTQGTATLAWAVAIRWLHDALAEDALDKVENHFSTTPQKSQWSLWVKTLRTLFR